VASPGICTYSDDIVGIGAVEVGNAYARWKRLLSFKCLVEALPEIGLYTQRLQNKDAHSHQALFRRVVALVDGVVQHKDYKVMSSISVDDERAEALVALQGLPEEHDHLGRPCQRLLTTGQVRCVGLQLARVSCATKKIEALTGWLRMRVMPSTKNWKS
jgi:hypothetical protein